MWGEEGGMFVLEWVSALRREGGSHADDTAGAGGKEGRDGED